MVEVSDVEIDVSNSVKFVERLNAIIAYESKCYSYHILACKKSTTPRGSWESCLGMGERNHKLKHCAELPGAKNIPPRTACGNILVVTREIFAL
jgi:hypothetical protein